MQFNNCLLKFNLFFFLQIQYFFHMYGLAIQSLFRYSSYNYGLNFGVKKLVVYHKTGQDILSLDSALTIITWLWDVKIKMMKIFNFFYLFYYFNFYISQSNGKLHWSKIQIFCHPCSSNFKANRKIENDRTLIRP